LRDHDKLIHKVKTRVAILGGGPSALFLYKKLVDSADENIEVDIFESKSQLGSGMPYSTEGANKEHITNVSDNEIPEIVSSIADWVQQADEELLKTYQIDKNRFNEYKVLPRLFFGQYLKGQFELLLQKAEENGLVTRVHYNACVIDVVDDVKTGKTGVVVEGRKTEKFDRVVICTGHKWPKVHEGQISGYYDSPYPPSKLQLKVNNSIAIKGASLTAIDAIRTLARSNGTFTRLSNGKTAFEVSEESPDFRLVLHSRNGMLPAVRFHLEEPLLSMDSLLTEEELDANRRENNGFLSLDFVFQKDFKEQFIEKQPGFYKKISKMSLEDFVEAMMDRRERREAFDLFREEYAEAQESIRKRESIYWKEMLAVLSFALNYPAKYFSAEDMQRLQKSLMPLISIVIAFVPQSSCEELLALNDAGRLDIISVGDDSEVEPDQNGGATYCYRDDNGKKQEIHFQTFVDCVGQPHLSYDEFPFKGMLEKNTISPALLQFKSEEKGSEQLAKGDKKVKEGSGGTYYLTVPGITITDEFQVVGQDGKANPRIYMMAVPYIGGYNPDYSGLDFCEEASGKIVSQMLQVKKAGQIA
jgi:uncharacterized NAD(P)/FAD-binding protein YdhS